MKMFEELTPDQKNSAIEFAKQVMLEARLSGVLQFTKFLTVKELEALAVEAAHHGTYSADGKPYIEGLEVPTYFLGGCV